ncbi:MAG: T9SS type A sorting domain-containing protein [Bacteroidetes bacterium]|nr:T9SS type A sorting domain-containing protein [Bacteroidota bacterium]
MKKIILSGFIILNYISIAQNNTQKIIYQKCTGFAITRPLSEMPVMSEEDLKISEKEEIEIRRKPFTNSHNRAAQNAIDPASQLSHGNKAMMAPIANWQGLSGSGYPPDPSGAAGPNHYVQAVNLSYKIYSKTGVTIGGPFQLKTLWAGSTNDGDPVVLYDKYADRWFVTQFNGADLILVAVSTSSNPVGSYFTYTFVPAPGTFPDYPKYSVWSDGYYCCSNLGAPENVAVFDRASMLAGNPSAGMIALPLPNVPNNGFFCPLPGDADGQLPPYGTPCPLFCYEDDTWSAGGTDQLNVFSFATDWATPSNSSLTLVQSLTTTPINVNFNVNWDDVPQPGTTQRLDAIAGVLNYRAQYRRWTGYNSVVINHAVIADSITGKVGTRWYELRQDTATNLWSIYQQSTFTPDGHSRWLASIAMDDFGNIGMAYAVSSPSVSPSLRYTGRLASDPLGQMTFSETIAVTGTGAQAGINRFGDYSQTTLDPDGITFWHTGEYLSGGGIRTRIFSWQLTSLPTVIHGLSNTAELLVMQDEDLLKIKGNKLPGNELVQADLFDVMGKLIASKKIKPENNSVELSFDVSALSKQTYLVRLGNNQFQKVVKVIVH